MMILRPLKFWLCGFMLSSALAACTMVGPDFVKPPVDVSQKWVEAEDPRVKTNPQDYGNWWQVFRDPALDSLIQMASEQNLPLRIAGVRVFEAGLSWVSPSVNSTPSCSRASARQPTIGSARERPVPRSPGSATSVSGRRRLEPVPAGSLISGESFAGPFSRPMPASLAPSQITMTCW